MSSTYTDTSFYVRHIPPVNGARTADEIAADICSSRNTRAVLQDAYQDVPLGIRYATYECIWATCTLRVSVSRKRQSARKPRLRCLCATLFPQAGYASFW